MSYKYSSVFAPYILDLIATKEAAGYTYQTAQYYLHNFDKYCCVHTKSGSFSRELITGWAKSRDEEEPGTHRTRISPIRELGKYMQAVGVKDVFILPSALHRKVERYVPHFFTNIEITAFFKACDNLKPRKGVYARHLVLPVFFRLLYCCGLRTCEARLLRVEDVDLQKATIDINSSKGHRSRKIPISEDLLKLFIRYDSCVRKIFHSRHYFFPTTKSDCYNRTSIGQIFYTLWKAAGLKQGCGNRPRAYDFRHHFALSNLNRWISSGLNVNAKIPYLSKYMGHSCLESTDYYLHLVPEFFQTFSEKVRNTETMLPEVDYERE